MTEPVGIWASRPAQAGRYRLNMAALTWPELRRMSPAFWVAVVAVVLFKVLRLKDLGQPSHMGYPTRVRTLPVDEPLAWAPDLCQRSIAALVAMRFTPLFAYELDSELPDPGRGVAFLSPDRLTFAHLLLSLDKSDPDGAPKPKALLGLSSGRDGTSRFWTTDQPPQTLTPLEAQTLRFPALDWPALVAKHNEERVSRAARLGDEAFPPWEEARMVAVITHDNDRNLEFLIERGVFVPAEVKPS